MSSSRERRQAKRAKDRLADIVASNGTKSPVLRSADIVPNPASVIPSGAELPPDEAPVAMKSSQRVAKNAFFGIFAAGVGGFLNFAAIFIVAHFLHVADFGTFSFLLAFATIFQFVADFGLSNILVREIARQPGKMEYLLGGSKALLWTLFFLSFVLMVIVLAFAPMTPQVKELSFVMGVGFLLLLHSVGYVSVLRAVEDMEFNAIGFVLHKVVLVILIASVLIAGLGLWGVVWSYFLANGFQWAFYHFLVTRRYTPGRMHRDWALWKSLIKDTLPMGGGMVLRQSAWQLDIFLLSCLASPVALGLFSGPFRILTGMTLLPAVITVPLFPLMVRLANESRPKFSELYQRVVKWYCVASFPIMAAGFAWPDLWVRLFLGEKYLPAAPALQILSFSVVPVFLSILYPFLFSALHIQKWFFLIMSGGVALRLAFGWWIIPRYGFLGEAVVIVAIEMALFFSMATYLYRFGQPSELMQNFFKPALAIVPAGLVLWIAREASYPLMAVAAIASSLVYLGTLYFLRIFSREELALVRESTGFIRAYRARLRGTKRA